MILVQGDGSKFFRRGLKISCGVHLFVMVLVGTAFSEVYQHDNKMEEYVLVDMEQEIAQQDLDSSVMPSKVEKHAFTKANSNKEAANSPYNRKTLHPTMNSKPTGNSTNHAQPNGKQAQAYAAESNDGAGESLVDGESDIDTGRNDVGNEEKELKQQSSIDIAGIAARFAAVVDTKKEYPYLALKRGETGRVEVLVRLHIDGSLGAAEIVQSSGVKSLDMGAIKAVEKTCPFSHGAGQMLEFIIPIYYELS